MVLSRQQQKAIFAKLTVKNNLRKTNPKFVNLMEKAFVETTPQLQNRIDSLILLKKKPKQSIGDIICRKRLKKDQECTRYEIRIKFDGKNAKEYPLVYNHELDHIFYDQIKRTNPKKVTRFKDDLKPVFAFNQNLKDVFFDVEKQIKTGDNKKIEDALDLFVDEIHSETKQQTDRIKIGLDPANIGKEGKTNLQTALKAYNKLHRK